MDRPKRARAVLLLTHAIFSTGPADEEETRICNARCSRARDRIMHDAPFDLVGPLGNLSPEAVEDVRSEALAVLHAECRTCGSCARFGLNPP